MPAPFSKRVVFIFAVVHDVCTTAQRGRGRRRENAYRNNDDDDGNDDDDDDDVDDDDGNNNDDDNDEKKKNVQYVETIAPAVTLRERPPPSPFH